MFHRSFHHHHLQSILTTNVHNPSSIFILHLSTTSTNHFMVNHLITSLNLTTPEAINVSTKLHHLKTPKNPQSVINFLSSYNLSKPEIKSIVISRPDILLRNVEKTLKPKFKTLSELGLSSQDLVIYVKKDPNFLSRSLIKSIIPTVDLLFKILGCKDKIVKAIMKSHWPLYGNYVRKNVLLLEQYGVCNKDIERVILRNPRLVTQNPLRLERKLFEAEKFGLTPGSAMFSYGLSAVCSLNSLNLRKKFEVFKSFGWCDSDVFSLVKRQPLCLTHSEERLRKVLSFFMWELGYTALWLSTRGSLLMYSLEKRVKPRYEVYVVLKEKGVLDQKLQSVMCLSNADFVKNVVQRHKDDMPDHLYDRSTKTLVGD